MTQPLVGFVRHSLDRNAFDYSLHNDEKRLLTITLSDGSQVKVGIVVKGMKKANSSYTVTGDVVEIGGVALLVCPEFTLLTTFEGKEHAFASQAAV
jgi:hypothetical protein